MTRTPAALLLALTAGPAVAQVSGPVTPQLVTARVEKDALVWTTTQVMPVQKAVAVTVVVGGREVIETRTVTELTRVTNERSVAVKDLRATDATGRAIPAARLTERLKDDSVVVLHVGRLPDAYRKVFQDDAVLIELPGPGGGRP